MGAWLLTSAAGEQLAAVVDRHLLSAIHPQHQHGQRTGLIHHFELHPDRVIRQDGAARPQQADGVLAGHWERDRGVSDALNGCRVTTSAGKTEANTHRRSTARGPAGAAACAALSPGPNRLIRVW